MEKRTKIIIGVVAGIALIGGIVYFRNKKRKKNLVQQAGQGEVLTADDIEIVMDDSPSDVSVDLKKSSDARATFPMGYLSNRKAHNGHPVMLNKRPPKGTIKAGDKVRIKGTPFDGEYVVPVVWIDKNNNVGGLYLPIQNKYVPKSTKDETYANKGVIELL